MKSKKSAHEKIDVAETSENQNSESTAVELEAEIENSDIENSELALFDSTEEILFTETDQPGFLPEANEETIETVEESSELVQSVEGTELDAFDSAEIEEVEFVEAEQLESIVESILFASDRPVSLASIKQVFKGTNIKTDKIRRALDSLAVEYAGGRRGVTLEEVPGGYQLRTKLDNMNFLKRTLKSRPFKLSGPALEVLAIVAYKQPLIKSEIDVIRGVESGHLLRALMEKGLVNFAGKSDLPGKPMQYGTTKKFLEIFNLRNLKELPSLSEIDELLPDGIDEVEGKKETLDQLTGVLSQEIGNTYSQGEEELSKITDQLQGIDTSSDFFEQEKRRQKEKRDHERAQNIREALALNETVSTRDKNWLTKFDEALATGTLDQFYASSNPFAKKKNIQTAVHDSAEVAADTQAETSDSESKLQAALDSFDKDEDLQQASSDEIFEQPDLEDHPDDLFLSESDMDSDEAEDLT